jgi:hypothetical protein
MTPVAEVGSPGREAGINSLAMDGSRFHGDELAAERDTRLLDGAEFKPRDLSTGLAIQPPKGEEICLEYSL